MGENRRKWLIKFGLTVASLGLAKTRVFASAKAEKGLSKKVISKYGSMKLGAFSISLTVKDIHASKLFYESMGFEVFAGDIKKNYLIMKNENALIGLFHGMFEKNILTFNPGWDENAKNLEKFDDVRQIQQHLKSQGMKLVSEADEKTTGPASLIVVDPDGNQILFDQHR